MPAPAKRKVPVYCNQCVCGPDLLKVEVEDGVALRVEPTSMSALGFLVSQAFILFACKGIPAWRAPLVPPLLVAMGLFEGMGLLALAAAAFPTHVSAGLSLPLAGLALALVNAGLWHRYRTTARAQGIGPTARWTIRSITPWLQLVGHANSAVIFSIALLGSTIHPPLLANTGFFMALTGAFCKYFLIVRAGYQQGYALPMMPQRGSGTRAAPPKLDAA